MTRQAQLNQARDSVIATYEGSLRGSYTFPDGSSTGNIEGFTSAEKIAKGLVPITDTKPAFDSDYEELAITNTAIDGDGNGVTCTWTAQDKNLDSVKADYMGRVRALRATKVEDCVCIGENAFSISALYMKCKEHCDAIEALTTAQDVAEYDIEAGW